MLILSLGSLVAFIGCMVVGILWGDWAAIAWSFVFLVISVTAGILAWNLWSSRRLSDHGNELPGVP